MDRKTWLKTFVGLAVSNAQAIEYRRRLRLKLPALAKHIKRLPEYMKELEALEEAERDQERLRKRQEAAAKARAELARKRAEARRRSVAKPDGELHQADTGSRPEDRPRRVSSSIEGSTTATPQRDEEAMGTREDSSED